MPAIVTVRRGPRSEKEALVAALAPPAGYIGMIGSPSKVRQIFRALLREGHTAEALARVHAPIGLDLHAETPDEIALSIAAELLLWRRGGTGAPLRDQEAIAGQVLAAAESTVEESTVEESTAAAPQP